VYTRLLLSLISLPLLLLGKESVAGMSSPAGRCYCTVVNIYMYSKTLEMTDETDKSFPSNERDGALNARYPILW